MRHQHMQKKHRLMQFSLRAIFVCAILLASACTPSSPTTVPASTTTASTDQSVDALGQTLFFSNPEHYCNVGDSLNEQSLRGQTARALAPIVLLHFAAPCVELSDLADGKNAYLDHWFQIQLVNQTRLKMGRDKFLAELAKQMPEAETDNIRQLVQDALKPKLSKEGLGLEIGSIKFLGHDENAAYLAFMMEIEAGGLRRIVTGMGAITLIKGVHVGLYFYDGTEDEQSQQHLPLILHDFVDNIVAANPD